MRFTKIMCAILVLTAAAVIVPDARAGGKPRIVGYPVGIAGMPYPAGLTCPPPVVIQPPPLITVESQQRPPELRFGAFGQPRVRFFPHQYRYYIKEIR